MTRLNWRYHEYTLAKIIFINKPIVIIAHSYSQRIFKSLNDYITKQMVLNISKNCKLFSNYRSNRF